MARLRFNGCSSALDGTTVSTSTTTLTFSGPTCLPAVASGDEIEITLAPDVQGHEEVVIAPGPITAGASSLTGVTRNAEPTQGGQNSSAEHTNVQWTHTSTIEDFFTWNVTAQSATYSAADADYILATAGSGGFTITLPAPSDGAQVGVKKVDSGAGTITVSHHSTETIDGASSVALTVQYDHVLIISDGTNWFQLDAYAASAAFESAVETVRLDQMANPTTAVAGNGQQATGWADGTHATDLATVEQTTNWVQDSNTWTRASNTSFTIAGNVTGIFVAGTAVKWTESSTQKYGVVASSSYSSPNTTVTLCSTSDYVMAASPDSNSNNWAHGQPRDFPMQFTWSITTSGWSGTPTTAGSFGVVGKNLCMLEFYVSGTSNGANADLTNPPFTPGGASARAYYSTIVAQDSGTVTPGTAQCSQGTATIKCCKGVNLAAISEGWTTSGTKTVMGNFIYPF